LEGWSKLLGTITIEISTTDSATKKAQDKEEQKGHDVKAIMIDIDCRCKAITKIETPICIILEQA
jgi:hypothetical protein